MIASPLSRRASRAHSTLSRRTILHHPAPLIFLLAVLFTQPLTAQQLSVKFFNKQNSSSIFILAGDQPFTVFIYPDSLAKPVLYPIWAPDGQLITRGFPMKPRPGEPVDHPHHLGLWFNYENVNGLDFWNNSYAIPADKKHLYGWIRTTHILKTRNSSAKDPRALLSYMADWTDQKRNVLLKETTEFYFSATAGERIIDRITTLTAKEDVRIQRRQGRPAGLARDPRTADPIRYPGAIHR